jgi:uncharacterized repeat protein (TIGR01451 family)
MLQELVTLLASVSVLGLLVSLVMCALGLRRRAIRRGLSWAEALSQGWAWLRTELSAWSPAAGSGSSAPNPRHFRTSRVWRAFLVLVCVAAILLVPHQVQPVSAQSGVGYVEYYVLGDEDDIMDALKDIPNSGVDLSWTGDNINSRLDIVSSADGINVYLDEHENGYNFTGDPSTADASWLALTRGGVLTLNEVQADGGDRLYITGGPVNVVRTIWPDVRPGQTYPGSYIAGSWEFYPTRAWQSSYTAPVGADTEWPPGENPFAYTYLFVQVQQDNTRVVIEDPYTAASPDIDIVLNRGENLMYPQTPYPPQGNPENTCHQGTRVTATDNTSGEPVPVQAAIATSSNGIYDFRYYTLTPEEYLNNSYILPVPSMTMTATEASDLGHPIAVETAVYIYSFQDNTDVWVETSTGSVQLDPDLDAGEVLRYVMLPQMDTANDVFEGDYGARIFINNPGPNDKIWALGAGDDNRADLDWGFQVLSPDYLRDNCFLPWAPSNPSYISPLYDDTTFFVDWDLDGTFDETFALDQLQTRMLLPPDTLNPNTVLAYDGTGAHIWAEKEFAIAWGQDHTQRTSGPENDGFPPDFDWGYTILPLYWFDPVLTIEKTVDPPSLPAEGGVVQFTLVVATEDYPVYNVDVSDVLPVGWEYVDNSTSIALSYDTGGSGPGYDPSISGDPSVSGYTLIWDLNGLGLNDTMPRNSSITLTYQARTIPGAYSAGLHDNLGQAYGEDEYGAIFRPEDHAFVFIPELPALSLAKTSGAGGLVNPGDTINYTIVISNVGVAPATNITVSDTLPTGTTYVPGTTQITAGGATNPGGAPPTLVSPADGYGLLPGESMTVTFQVTVDDPLAPGITQIINTASVTSTEIITPSTDTVTDIVPSAPAIEIAKTVYLGHDGGLGCPGGESVTGANGADVTYCFEVTNTGGTYLASIVITDTALGIPPATVTLQAGMSDPYPPLAPGDSLVYYYESTINGDLVNTGCVQALPDPYGPGTPTPTPGGETVTDADPAAVKEYPRITDPPKTVTLITATPTTTPVPPTPTEVLTVERLPETGRFPGGFTVFLSVLFIIGAASILNLALLEKKGRRGDGKGH